jgi:hypothetical protein
MGQLRRFATSRKINMPFCKSPISLRFKRRFTQEMTLRVRSPKRETIFIKHPVKERAAYPL